jgi:phage gp36-like protein
MAAPQVQEITLKVEDKVIITFDQALDDRINVPLTAFSINYGRIPLSGWTYFGTASVVLKLARTLTPKDKIEVNYQPPDDLNLALRAPVADNASSVVIRRNVVRAFYKVPALNQLRINEGVWNEMSNLGTNGDISNGDNPEGGGGGGGNWNPCNHGGDASGTSPMSGGGGSAAPTGPYPIEQRPNPRTATPDDFILAYGLREAIQLSNIDDADAIQPNTDKIWMAIQDACALIDNYIAQAGRAGKLLISSNRRRTALIIARYYLDTVRRREDVYRDYELAIKDLDRAVSMESVVRPDPPWWADPCNPNRGKGVRSWRIPQYYNGVSGKGFSGWWNDSGYEEVNDWRYERKNSENNNNESNWGRGGQASRSDTRTPEQPTDGGGIDVGHGSSS